MTPREIIARAWAMTKAEKKLRRWGFVHALFETMRSVELLLYQAFYMYWYFQNVTVGWLSVEMLFFKNLPLWLAITITVFLCILLVLQLFIPTLATGALIGLAAKAYKKEEVKGGLILGLYNFFPILEVHGLFILGNFAASITVSSIIIRYGADVKMLAFGLLALLTIFSVIFRFFASFAEEGIVIRKLGVFDAIGRSFKLIISNIGHVVFVLILLVVISLRIIINAVMIFLLPAIIIGIGFLLGTFLPAVVSYTIATVVGFALLLVLSYFFAYLQTFKQTVWTLTYLELSNKKDLDVIEVKKETTVPTPPEESADALPEAV